MSRQIKTTCVECGTEFFLEGPSCADEFEREMAIRLAALTSCRACSIYIEKRAEIAGVEDKNRKIIWNAQRERDALEFSLGRKPTRRAELEPKIAVLNSTIAIARTDLVSSLTALGMLDDARALQLSSEPQRKHVGLF